MNNQLTAQKSSFLAAINSSRFQSMINKSLQNPDRARRFTSAITSAVNNNPQLQDCAAETIVVAALLGESLNLSPSPQLGQYYLVPFNDSKRECKVAQFQLGYKGYIQLALRSGYYKKLNVVSVKEGELIEYNPFDEDIKINPITDEGARENAPTIGYYAMFEYLNGFRKILYWSKEKMEHHAQTYSPGYRAHKGKTFWEKDFDAMAYKTMLRQLISKWGIMSIEMQQAYESDMGVLRDGEAPEYIETTDRIIPQNEYDDTVPIGAMTQAEHENRTLSMDDI